MTREGSNRWRENEGLFKKILVPTDGSENAGRALEVAVDLGRRYESEVIIMNAVQVPHNLLAAASAPHRQPS